MLDSDNKSLHQDQLLSLYGIGIITAIFLCYSFKVQWASISDIAGPKAYSLKGSGLDSLLFMHLAHKAYNRSGKLSICTWPTRPYIASKGIVYAGIRSGIDKAWYKSLYLMKN